MPLAGEFGYSLFVENIQKSRLTMGILKISILGLWVGVNKLKSLCKHLIHL